MADGNERDLVAEVGLMYFLNVERLSHKRPDWRAFVDKQYDAWLIAMSGAIDLCFGSRKKRSATSKESGNIASSYDPLCELKVRTTPFFRETCWAPAPVKTEITAPGTQEVSSSSTPDANEELVDDGTLQLLNGTCLTRTLLGQFNFSEAYNLLCAFLPTSPKRVTVMCAKRAAKLFAVFISTMSCRIDAINFDKSVDAIASTLLCSYLNMYKWVVLQISFFREFVTRMQGSASRIEAIVLNFLNQDPQRFSESVLRTVLELSRNLCLFMGSNYLPLMTVIQQLESKIPANKLRETREALQEFINFSSAQNDALEATLPIAISKLRAILAQQPKPLTPPCTFSDYENPFLEINLWRLNVRPNTNQQWVLLLDLLSDCSLSETAKNLAYWEIPDLLDGMASSFQNITIDSFFTTTEMRVANCGEVKCVMCERSFGARKLLLHEYAIYIPLLVLLVHGNESHGNPDSWEICSRIIRVIGLLTGVASSHYRRVKLSNQQSRSTPPTGNPTTAENFECLASNVSVSAPKASSYIPLHQAVTIELIRLLRCPRISSMQRDWIAVALAVACSPQKNTLCPIPIALGGKSKSYKLPIMSLPSQDTLASLVRVEIGEMIPTLINPPLESCAKNIPNILSFFSYAANIVAQLPYPPPRVVLYDAMTAPMRGPCCSSPKNHIKHLFLQIKEKSNMTCDLQEGYEEPISLHFFLLTRREEETRCNASKKGRSFTTKGTFDLMEVNLYLNLDHPHKWAMMQQTLCHGNLVGVQLLSLPKLTAILRPVLESLGISLLPPNLEKLHVPHCTANALEVMFKTRELFF
ncbi:hypothetical protein Pelo_2138 [Pelomyxa schiedti]|nr:hypothetical protein Pelo_2138 [Pelomyxa schiedti]